jgi:CheY-like chemotaxis protein
MRVLLVEDDLDDIAVYEEVLRDLDNTLEIDKAFNGSQALERLKMGDSSFDLILLDFNLPIMNGLDFLTKIRSNQKLKDQLVVVLSTSCSNNDMKAFGSLKADCNSKPSTYEEIKNTLQKILSKAKQKVDHADWLTK